MGRPASALAVGCHGKDRFSVSSKLHWAIRLCNSTSDVFKCVKVKELSSCTGWLVGMYSGFISNTQVVALATTDSLVDVAMIKIYCKQWNKIANPS